jgi:hypothetical protein
LPPPSLADLVAKAGTDTIRLSEGACVHGGTLGHIRPEYREQFKKARASLNGQDWFACWIRMPNGDFFIMFEDGDQVVIRASDFKDDPGV